MAKTKCLFFEEKENSAQQPLALGALGAGDPLGTFEDRKSSEASRSLGLSPPRFACPHAQASCPMTQHDTKRPQMSNQTTPQAGVLQAPPGIWRELMATSLNRCIQVQNAACPPVSMDDNDVPFPFPWNNRRLASPAGHMATFLAASYGRAQKRNVTSAPHPHILMDYNSFPSVLHRKARMILLEHASITSLFCAVIRRLPGSLSVASKGLTRVRAAWRGLALPCQPRA